MLSAASPLYPLLVPPHAAAACVAVAAGALALTARKGAEWHRRAGRGYARAIAAVALTGAALLGLGAWSVRLLVLLALTASVTWSGVRVLRRRRPDVAPADRARRADWAMAGAALAAALGACAAAAAGVEPRNAAAVWSTAPLLGAYAAYDLWRFARPAAWPMRPRLWLGEHVVKMTGAYFGAVSALSGNLFTAVPQPWRIVAPNVVGVLVTAYFLARLRRPGAPARRPGRWWWAVAAGAVLVAAYGLSYLARGEAAFTGEVAGAFRARPLGIYVHALAGSLVLLTLPLQFAPGLRARRPRLHRAAGRVYAAAGLATAAAGFSMALHAYGGPATRLAFGLLAVASFAATALALAAAVRGDLAAHHRWALRSAALFFAAVTLRVELPLVVALHGGDFRPAYAIVAWLCWVPNLAWAEWWLRRRRAPAPGAAAGALPGALPGALQGALQGASEGTAAGDAVAGLTPRRPRPSVAARAAEHAA